MEVSCPKCSQRLRYSDQLVNPLLRCRNCLTTFRPSEANLVADEPVAAVAVDDDNPAKPDPFRQLSAEPLPQASTTSANWYGKGLGSIGVIVLIIAFKVAPRILREALRERKPPPPPVQMRHDEQQAIEKLLKDAENAARQKRFQPLPADARPNPVIPDNP